MGFAEGGYDTRSRLEVEGQPSLSVFLLKLFKPVRIDNLLRQIPDFVSGLRLPPHAVPPTLGPHPSSDHPAGIGLWQVENLLPHCDQ